LGLSLNDSQLLLCTAHLQELNSWAERLNLTGYRSDRARAIYLTVDSMIFVTLLSPRAESLLDIGSGNGFPGVIIKVLLPDIRVVLIEANRRRSNFLKHLCRKLDLTGLEVLSARAEAVESTLDLRFDVVTLRSVSRPEAAVSLGSPFLRPGGTLLLSLGPKVAPPPLPRGWAWEILSIPLPFSPIRRRILRIQKP